jgi:hypothetical protein
VLVATIRGGGTPRLSPVEPFVMDGDLWLSMMWQSRKAAAIRARRHTIGGRRGGIFKIAQGCYRGPIGALARPRGPGGSHRGAPGEYMVLMAVACQGADVRRHQPWPVLGSAWGARGGGERVMPDVSPGQVAHCERARSAADYPSVK